MDYNLETLRLVFTDLVVIDFTREDARASGEIRAALAAAGMPIGPSTSSSPARPRPAS